LCSSWQGFNWLKASRGPSAIAKLLVHIWRREWIPSASEIFTYLFYLWRKYDVSVTFVTLMSCATASAACVTRLGAVADWWRSWLMANTLACLCSWQWWTFWFLNILCDCQFVFSVLDELYVSNHAWCHGQYFKTALQKYEVWCFVFTR